MRLQKITFLPTLALSCAALTLAACGDDGSTGGSGAGSSGTSSVTTTTDTDPQPNTTEDSVDTTAAPGDSTTDDPTTGLDSTGDESSSGSDDTTSGPMGDCPGGGMSFSTLTSADNGLVTNLDVSSLVLNCNMDITITALGGTVCAVDDGAGGYFYTVETMDFADVPEMECDGAQVGLTDVRIDNTGDGAEVVVPQAGGAMTGNQSIIVQGNVEGMAVGMKLDTPLMDFSGVLPEGDVGFGADDTTITYADTTTVVATAMPMVSIVVVTVTLTGLTGSLTFGP